MTPLNTCRKNKFNYFQSTNYCLSNLFFSCFNYKLKKRLKEKHLIYLSRLKEKHLIFIAYYTCRSRKKYVEFNEI